MGKKYDVCKYNIYHDCKFRSVTAKNEGFREFQSFSWNWRTRSCCQEKPQSSISYIYQKVYQQIVMLSDKNNCLVFYMLFIGTLKRNFFSPNLGIFIRHQNEPFRIIK